LIVRKPRPDELGSTVILMEYYRDEANLPDGEYDDGVMLQSIRNYMIYGDHCWFNLYEGSRAVGLIAGYLCEIPWSRKIQAHVQFIYTLPSHRNKTNADQLIKEFESWASNNGACRITAGDIGINTERTKVFYESHGYQPRGINLDKELTNV